MTIGQIRYINDVMGIGVMTKGFGDTVVWRYNGSVYVFSANDLYNLTKDVKPINS